MRLWTRRVIRFGARLSITGLLLVWVLAQIDREQLHQTVQTARWEHLLGVWLFATVFLWVQSFALKLILAQQDCRVTLNTLFGASCVTALYSLVLPGILSTGVKWYILSRDTGKMSNVLSSMLYNQVMLSIVMVVTGLVGLIVTNPARILVASEQWQRLLPITCGTLLAMVMLLSILALNKRTGGVMIRLLQTALRPFPQTLRQKGHTILTHLAVFQSVRLRFHLAVGLIDAFDGFAINLLMYLFAAKAAGVVLPVSVLIWLGALVFILGRIPISIANLGVREVTLVGLLAGYGVGKPTAMLMSMILFSALIFLAVVGAAYQLIWTITAKSATGKSSIAVGESVPERLDRR